MSTCTTKGCHREAQTEREDERRVVALCHECARDLDGESGELRDLRLLAERIGYSLPEAVAWAWLDGVPFVAIPSKAATSQQVLEILADPRAGLLETARRLGRKWPKMSAAERPLSVIDARPADDIQDARLIVEAKLDVPLASERAEALAAALQRGARETTCSGDGCGGYATVSVQGPGYEYGLCDACHAERERAA